MKTAAVVLTTAAALTALVAGLAIAGLAALAAGNEETCGHDE